MTKLMSKIKVASFILDTVYRLPGHVCCRAA